MDKKIKKEKEDGYKISATVLTNEELKRLDNKIEFDLDNIVNQITNAVLKERETIFLQMVIEKQQNKIKKTTKEIENIKEYINSPEFLDWNLGFKLIDELEYRKDRINELLGE